MCVSKEFWEFRVLHWSLYKMGPLKLRRHSFNHCIPLLVLGPPILFYFQFSVNKFPQRELKNKTNKQKTWVFLKKCRKKQNFHLLVPYCNLEASSPGLLGHSFHSELFQNASVKNDTSEPCDWQNRSHSGHGYRIKEPTSFPMKYWI